MTSFSNNVGAYFDLNASGWCVSLSPRLRCELRRATVNIWEQRERFGGKHLCGSQREVARSLRVGVLGGRVRLMSPMFSPFGGASGRSAMFIAFLDVWSSFAERNATRLSLSFAEGGLTQRFRIAL